MRKLIAAINMTLDGYCDHTAVNPGEEIHQHYRDLINAAGVILYGRTTYGLMQYWQTLLQEPSDEKSLNDFAQAIDKIPKIVFSHTLKDTGWDSAELAAGPLEQVAAALKQQAGKDVLVGSRSLIIQLLNHHLIDELQLCIHPVIVGEGLPLFDKISGRTGFKLVKTETFSEGAVIHYYQPADENMTG